MRFEDFCRDSNKWRNIWMLELMPNESFVAEFLDHLQVRILGRLKIYLPCEFSQYQCWIFSALSEQQSSLYIALTNGDFEIKYITVQPDPTHLSKYLRIRLCSHTGLQSTEYHTQKGSLGAFQMHQIAVSSIFNRGEAEIDPQSYLWSMEHLGISQQFR